MPRVVHFEIPTDQPERAIGFYGDVFGWRFTKWEGPQPYWLISTGTEGPGIDGGLLQRSTGPGAWTVNTIDVPDVDEFARKVTEKGGEVVAPKMAIPGVGWLAYCKDPDGNVFGIHATDPGAGS